MHKIFTDNFSQCSVHPPPFLLPPPPFAKKPMDEVHVYGEKAVPETNVPPALPKGKQFTVFFFKPKQESKSRL